MLGNDTSMILANPDSALLRPTREKNLEALTPTGSTTDTMTTTLADQLNDVAVHTPAAATGVDRPN